MAALSIRVPRFTLALAALALPVALATASVAAARPAGGANPSPPAAAADVRGGIGIAAGGELQYLTPADLARELDGYARVGAAWIRFDFNWSGIERQKGVYDWSRHDAVVDAATARGLRVLGLIAYTPAWARPPGTDNKHAPTDVKDYASFVGEAVRRYAPRGVRHWELWNEPNHSGFWKPCPDVKRYTSLLRLGSAAARSADPAAFVLAGGMSPAVDNGCNVAPRTFLAGIYANGGKGSFDALAHHPYSFPAEPGTPHAWSAWHQMVGTSPSLRSIMVENGDADKAIWATEWGVKVGSVDERTQADMLTRAYSLFGSYSWAGPMFTYTYRDRDSFGLVRSDWSPRPAWAAFQAAALVR